MSLAVHCDRDGCDTWQRTESDVAVEWFKVTVDHRFATFRRSEREEWNFCTLDCLTHWAAKHSSPSETLTSSI